MRWVVDVFGPDLTPLVMLVVVVAGWLVARPSVGPADPDTTFRRRVDLWVNQGWPDTDQEDRR